MRYLILAVSLLATTACHKENSKDDVVEAWQVQGKQFEENLNWWNTTRKPLSYSYRQILDTDGKWLKVAVDVINNVPTCRSLVEIGDEGRGLLWKETKDNINTNTNAPKAKTIGEIYQRCQDLYAKNPKEIRFYYYTYENLTYLKGCNLDCNDNCDLEELPVKDYDFINPTICELSK